MVVDQCIVCGREIEDFDLAFLTNDGKGTVCSPECHFDYEEKNKIR